MIFKTGNGYGNGYGNGNGDGKVLYVDNCLLRLVFTSLVVPVGERK
jgi:hypothetical protein